MFKSTDLLILAICIAILVCTYLIGHIDGVDYATDMMEANLPLQCYFDFKWGK